MGTTQQEDMTNTTPQVENVVNSTSEETHWTSLVDELLITEERWRIGYISKFIWKIRHSGETMIDSVEKLEDEIYRFRLNHEEDPEYGKLLMHIRNKITMDNNVHTEVISIATVMMAFVSLVISIVTFFYQINDKVFNLKKESESCEDAAKYIMGYLFEYKIEVRIITLILLLLFLGIITIIWPSVSGAFKGRVRQKNFYEICLNILDKQNSDQ